MLWYASGYWYLGKKDELGKSQGWLCVRDLAAAPELVQQIWRVGDGNAPRRAQRQVRGDRRARDRGPRVDGVEPPC